MIQCAIDLIELIGLPFQSLYGIELFDVSIIRFGQMCRVCIVTSTSIHLSQSGPTVVILGGTPTANQGNTTPIRRHSSPPTFGPTLPFSKSQKYYLLASIGALIVMMC